MKRRPVAPILLIFACAAACAPAPVDENSYEGVIAELTALIELRRSMMPESPFIKSPVFQLAIDGDVTWDRVVATVAESVASGIHRMTFLFHDPLSNLKFGCHF